MGLIIIKEIGHPEPCGDLAEVATTKYIVNQMFVGSS